MIKLDLGAGPISPAGYQPLGHFHGTEIYPLPYEDNSVDEIRASHVLEHFSTAQVPEVVKHWASKLKPGGVMKIAVPDFDWIAQVYLDGVNAPIEGYVMGGQTDQDDFHKSTFNSATLVDLFRGANLTDIGRWDSDAPDCSSLPVSLNMRAVKPVKLEQPFRVTAVMSLPRTHWTANFRCVQVLAPLGIALQAYEGVYWSQCLERGLDRLITDGMDAVLTVDYDTVYVAQHVQTLIRLMLLHPEADAICAMQSARGWDSILATVDLPEGTPPNRVPRTILDADLMKLKTGHFGLTLIRTSSLKGVKKPWFLGVPAPDGSWGDGHVDEDIYFWRQWAQSGKTLYAANRVAVGHIEPMIKWPGCDLGVIHQRAAEFWNSGPPKDVWK
ncbi:MAG TPA: methyltransferase domain-containing protein [Anaerolineae bacterium]